MSQNYSFINIDPVQTNPIPCNQPTGCLEVKATGTYPPFTYKWSGSSADSAHICGIVPGVYTVTVTDANGCQAVDTYDLYSLPPDFYPTISHSDIEHCNQTVWLQAEVSNGFGTYQFHWSTGDTTSLITNMPAGYYRVTVTSNVTGCSDLASVQINNYTTQYWNLALKSVCPYPDTSLGNLHLLFSPGGGIEFPVTVTWSDGTTRVIQQEPVVANSVLDSILLVPTGMYAVTLQDSNGCTKTLRQATVCIPPPPYPSGNCPSAFYIKDDYLNQHYDVDSCTGVFARDFEQLTALDFSLGWQENWVAFKNIKNVALPGWDNSNITSDSLHHRIGVSWQAPGGVPVSLAPDTKLFDVCFKQPHAAQDYMDLFFTNTPVNSSVKGAMHQDMGFIGMAGYVIFGLYFPASPAVCDFCVEYPSCATDGRGALFLKGCNPEKALNSSFTEGSNYVYGGLGMVLADSAVYQISAWQQGKAGVDLMANVPFKHDSIPCVWPGDADDNNAVNHHDLLYIGLAYDSVGIPRAGASIEWTGQASPD